MASVYPRPMTSDSLAMGTLTMAKTIVLTVYSNPSDDRTPNSDKE